MDTSGKLYHVIHCTLHTCAARSRAASSRAAVLTASKYIFTPSACRTSDLGSGGVMVMGKHGHTPECTIQSQHAGAGCWTLCAHAA